MENYLNYVRAQCDKSLGLIELTDIELESIVLWYTISCDIPPEFLENLCREKGYRMTSLISHLLPSICESYWMN